MLRHFAVTSSCPLRCLNSLSNIGRAQDLDKFYKALDKALMEFHSMKMQEINAVLSDLWRLTYKCTDIDEVIIKSDINEEGAEAAASAGRKQYNYRVVVLSRHF